MSSAPHETWRVKVDPMYLWIDMGSGEVLEILDLTQGQGQETWRGIGSFRVCHVTVSLHRVGQLLRDSTCVLRPVTEQSAGHA